MKFLAISEEENVRKMAFRGVKLALLLLGGGFLAIVHSNMAQAQMINPFGVNSGATLGKEDYKLAREAVVKLLDEKTLTVGSYDTWHNPASGNHGTFTILDIFTSKGMPCRKVNSHTVYRKVGANPRNFTLDVCKLPSGEWKTVA